jgi:hypothetical protein
MDIVIKGRSNDFDVTIGSADWGKNIAASLITGTLTLGIGFLWAGASAVTYKVFEEKLWGYINDQIQLISNTYPTASLNDSSMMFCRSSRFCEKCGSRLV